MAEFSGLRASLYEEAITQHPYARKDDIEAMHRLLSPSRGEHVLGIGEGNGYFYSEIARAVGPAGRYVVTDPSEEQLRNLLLHHPFAETRVAGAESLEIGENAFVKVWSFGAFHHCPQQTSAMQNIYRVLQPGGTAVICDVFQGSSLAKHFDSQVARYCETGHEVKFLSDAFAYSLTHLAGFSEQNVRIENLNLHWRFDSERDLGEFIYKLHALTKLPGTYSEKVNATIKGCREMLGIEQSGNEYLLSWPMKALVAVK